MKIPDSSPILVGGRSKLMMSVGDSKKKARNSHQILQHMKVVNKLVGNIRRPLISLVETQVELFK